MSMDAGSDVHLAALEIDAHGRFDARLSDGTVHADVLVVRAFPLSAPDAAISLVGRDGREVCWIPDLAQLDTASRKIVAAALAERDIVPRIERIVAVSSFVTPSEWQVLTDRGGVTLTLRAEEDIRRLGAHTLLITDRYGVSFRIDDSSRLDAGSRRLLDRFL